MLLTAPWLAVVGTIVLLVGLALSIADWTSRASVGLVLLVGCLFWVAFLVINELSRDSREPVRNAAWHDGVPWDSLWPFIALPAIAAGTVLVMRVLR